MSFGLGLNLGLGLRTGGGGTASDNLKARLNGQADLEGTLQGIPRNLAGALTGSANLTGDVSVIKELAGSFTGTADLVGDLTNVWTPAELGSSLALWLDADDASTITLNGSQVAQWNDKSGNNRHATQAIAANQPTYTANALNGQPGLVFDGINDFMSGTDWWLTEIGDGAFSVFHVFESSSDDFGISVNTANVTGAIPRHYFLAQNMSYNTQNTLILGGYDNSAVFQEWSHDGVQTLQMRRNGGAAVSATQSAIAPSQGFYAFPFKHGNVAQPGKSSEHVVVKGSISATDRQKLEGYLAHKWGLESNLPIGHPYKTTPPTV